MSPLVAQQPPVGQGLLIIEASRTHSDTPHSAGLLWTRDQLVAETSTWQYTTFTRTQISIPLAGFEPVVPANERPQTNLLYRVAIAIGKCMSEVAF